MDGTERTPLLGAQVEHGGSRRSSSGDKDTDLAAEDVGSRRNVVLRAFLPTWVSLSPRNIIRAYRFRSLVAVKPVEKFREEREARPEGQRLAERLGVIDLLGYGVGSTVGAGIYSLIGVAAGIAGEFHQLCRVRCCVSPDSPSYPLDS